MRHVYAAGGSRIELGDGDEMLSKNIFPSIIYICQMNTKYVKKRCKILLLHYQNLLRDGLEDNGHQIEFVDQNQSSDGQPNTIWAYSKSGNGFDTIQMINYLAFLIMIGEQIKERKKHLLLLKI